MIHHPWANDGNHLISHNQSSKYGWYMMVVQKSWYQGLLPKQTIFRLHASNINRAAMASGAKPRPWILLATPNVQVFKWRISGEIFWNAMTCHFHPFWGLERQHVDLATKHTIRLFKRLNFLHFRATVPSNFCVVMAAASQKDVLKLALRPKKCLHMFAPCTFKIRSKPAHQNTW